MRVQRFFVLLAAVAMLAGIGTVRPSVADAQLGLGADGLVVHESTLSFDATWAALTGALDANPNIRTIATVDHAAAAATAGLSLEPNRVVFFGNPNLGSPVMAQGRSAALDLPQKIQVFERGGQVFVAYNPTSYLAERHGVGAAPTLPVIAGALRNLSATATGGHVDAASATSVSAGGVTTVASANDFETTWARLVSAIDASPANVAFTVDHGANSGGALAPTRLVVFGNPQIGTPLMADSATAGIDLPLKIVVWQDDYGVTQVSSTDVAWIKQRHGIGNVATLANATGAIANFTRAATTAASVPATNAPTTQTGVGLAYTGTDSTLVVLAAGLLSLGGAFTIAARRRDDS